MLTGLFLEHDGALDAALHCYTQALEAAKARLPSDHASRHLYLKTLEALEDKLRHGGGGLALPQRPKPASNLSQDCDTTTTQRAGAAGGGQAVGGGWANICGRWHFIPARADAGDEPSVCMLTN
jgi:hypothetical protein